MANVRDALIAALEDLEDAKFREFKFKLKGFPVKSGYNRIPWGQLERADRLDLTDKLISFYQKDYAQEVTLGVLRGINMNNVASDFAAGKRLPRAGEGVAVVSQCIRGGGFGGIFLWMQPRGRDRVSPACQPAPKGGRSGEGQQA